MNKELIKMDALEDIIETLDYFTGYYCDLHDEVFNTDYYIIGTYEAKEALNEYDIFDAIEKVQEYEKDNFGEVNTDLSDPEKLINMLYYIIGEEILSEIKTLSDHWDDLSTVKINTSISDELKIERM